ncbi:MAG: DNA (cytosine-5-)-methyltransferase [Rhizonema sp. NSF051]|nr:DNA (cytosine-5-)-methyltransferase [Rhizonema sp. NSF051]
MQHREENMQQHFCLSYFAGIGGFSLGAKAVNYATLGVEWIPELSEIYDKNVGDIVVADIAKLNPCSLDIPTLSDRHRNNTKLVWQISPPCQEFSVANTKRDITSIRANILEACYSHVEVLQADVIILENVRGYRSAKVYKDFCDVLRILDYQVTDSIINAADFGVPQSRDRLIMLAVKNGESMPKLTPTLSQNNWIGWHEAVKDLLDTLHESQLTANQQKVAKTNSIVQRVGYYNGKPNVREASKPCWTIRAHLADDGKGNGRNKFIDCILENSEVRSLSVQALARLQSFPDDFQWTGVNSLDVRGIGNSVPPLLAQKICEAIA